MSLVAGEYIHRRQVRLYLTPEETEHLEALARHFGITKSQAIRAAVERLYRSELGGDPSPGSATEGRCILDERV